MSFDSRLAARLRTRGVFHLMPQAPLTLSGGRKAAVEGSGEHRGPSA
jgi:hypothetical protein